MDKRYQVFVSSTYTDLKDERSKVIQALMEMDCIPAGMELFPAADEDQWQFIEKIIDDCDYYLLIIGGRYGSMTPEGISYTEKEYDYAVAQGLRVIALIHGATDNLPVSKSDLTPEKLEKLVAFRAKVSSGRLVKFWQSPTELPGLVALSLSKTIKTYPAIGWVRANTVANIDLLSEVNGLRKRNEELEATVRQMRAEFQPAAAGIASLEENFPVTGTFKAIEVGRIATRTWKGSITWATAFGLVAPHLIQAKNDITVAHILAKAIFDILHKDGDSPELDDQVFQTIKVQFLAHRLITLTPYPTTQGSSGLFWELTRSGREQMLALRTIKKTDNASS